MNKVKRLGRPDEEYSRSLVGSKNITEITSRIMHAPSFASWSVEARECIAVYAAAVLESESPTYLELPAAIASIACHPFYSPARPYGRAEYRDAMYEVDEETGQVRRSPLWFTCSEVLDIVDIQVRIPHDRRLAVAIPLAFQVGFMVECGYPVLPLLSLCINSFILLTSYRRISRFFAGIAVQRNAGWQFLPVVPVAI